MDYGDLNQGPAEQQLGFLKTQKRVLFGGYFAVRSQMVLGRNYFILSTILMTLEIIYFPISTRGQFLWPNWIQDQAAGVLEIISVGYYNFPLEVGYYILGLLTMLGTGLAACGIAILGYSELSKTDTYHFIIPYLEVMLKFFQTILLIPMMGILTRFALCPSADMSLCDSGGRTAIQLIAMFFIAIFSAMNLLTSLFLVHYSRSETNMKAQDVCTFAAPHGRAEFIATLVRGSLAFVVGVIPTDTVLPHVVQTVWVAILMVSALVLLGVYIYYLPFMRMSWTRISVAANSVYFWLCINLVIVESLNDAEDLSAIVLFFGALPVVMYAFDYIVDIRIAQLTDSNLDIATLSPFMAEVRIRLMASKGQSVCTLKLEDVDEEFKKALKHFPHSSYLKVCIATLSTNTSRIVYSLNLIREAKESRPSLDQEFFIYCLNKTNMEKHNNGAGAASFMTFDKNLQDTRDGLISTLKQMLFFWRSIERGSFTLHQLIENGAKIHAESSKCRGQIDNLLQVSKNSPEAVRLSAIFSYYIRNDPILAARIMERQMNQHSTVDSNMGYAVCLVSGNSNSLGKILNVTHAMSGMFGYSKKELIGRNVNMLCPPPFSHVHDLMLKQFLSIDADFVTTTRQVYGVHHQGYLMALDFTMTPSTNANSDLILIGRFNHRSDPGSHMILVDVYNNLVTACSEMIPELLDIDINDVVSMNVHLLDIIPDFFDEPNGTESKYFTATGQRTTLNGRKLIVSAKRLMFDSRSGAPTSFKCGVILLKVVIDFEAEEALAENVMGFDVGAEEDVEEADDDDYDDGEDEVAPLQYPATLNTMEPHSSGSGLLDVEMGQQRKLPLRANKTKLSSVGQRSAGQRSAGQRSVGSLFKRGVRGARQSSVGSSVMDNSEMTIGTIHKVLTQRILRKDIHIQSLRSFFMAFSLGFMLIYLLRLTVMIILFGRYTWQNELLLLSYLRTYVIATICTVVEYTRNMILVDNGEILQRETPNTTILLNGLLYDLRQIHGVILDGDKASVQDENSMLLDSIVPMTLDGSEMYTTSFHMSVLEFSSHLENHIYTDKSTCHDSCKFLLNNGPFGVYNQSTVNSQQYLSNVLSTNQWINDIALYSMFGTIGLLLILILTKVIPMIRMSNRKKQLLGEAFVSIPAESLQTLQRRMDCRINHIATVLTNQGITDFEHDEAEALNSFLASTASKSQMPASDFHIGTNISSHVEDGEIGVPVLPSRRFLSCFCCKRRARQTMGKISPEKMGQISNTFQVESWGSKSLHYARLLIAIGLNIWIVIAFSVILWWTDSRAASILSSKSNDVNAAGLRNVYGGMMHLWNSHFINGTDSGFRTEFQYQQDFVENYRNNFVIYVNALSYGNSSMDIGGFESTSGDLYTLYFEDACASFCDKFSPVPLAQLSNTSVSMAKDMTNGLLHALFNYVEYSNDLITQRGLAAPNESPEVLAASQVFSDLSLILLLKDRLVTSTQIYLSVLDAAVAGLRANSILAYVSFVLCMIFGYFWTSKALARMEQELKDSERLLFMLPLEVFEEVVEMRSLLTNIDS